MIDYGSKYNISDLIDIEFLQEMQDAFAQSMNVASITVDDHGPLTKPSEFTDFCIKYTRGSAEGYKRCNECDIKCGKSAARSGKPVIYSCHSGLTDFAVPIIIDGQHIASILGGQVLTAPPDENKFRKLARELGIDEDEYIEALRKIKIVPIETVEAAANFLYLVANAISKISHKNLELIKQSERDTFLRIVTEKMSSMKDIDEALSYICDETAKLLKVQRSVITVPQDVDNYENFSIKREYKFNSKIKGLESFVNFDEIAKFWGHKLLGGEGIYAIENMEESDAPDFFKENYLALGVKSIVGVGIRSVKDSWGVLVLSEYNRVRKWRDGEIELLKILSNQLYLAIKQSELKDAIRKKTANQNAILNNMPFAAWLKDTKGRLLAVNSSYAKLSKAEIGDLIGKTEFDLFPQKIAESSVNEDSLVMEQRKTISEVIQSDGPDGLSWYEIFKSPVFDDNGKVIGTVGISQDITKRKESEFELLNKQAEILKINERESALKNIILASVSTFDLQSVIKAIVTEAGMLFEADRCFFVENNHDENPGNGANDYTEYLSSPELKSQKNCKPDETEKKLIANVLLQGKVLAESDTSKKELREATKKLLVDELSVKSYMVAPIIYGEVMYGAIILHYVHNYKQFTQEDINVIQMIANQSAVLIQQAKLYSTIEKNKEYTSSILNSIKDGIVTINDDFAIRSCNPSVEAIWGYSVSEVIGKSLDLLIHYQCDQLEEKACLLKKEFYGTKKDGQKFPVEIDVSDINFGGEKSTLLVIRDITERKKIEKMKNEFISTVSHELRTPLTSIKGSLGLMGSGVLGPLPEKVSGLINIANNNCSRLTNLINDILDLEKIKAGKYEFKYEELEINSVLQQSLLLNQSYAEQFNMKLKLVNLEGEAFVKADKNRLMQVISNLISNAVKFSNPGGEVTIISEIKNQSVKVSVVDFGIGIPDDSKYKIFQSFSQVDSSDTRSKGGTGLGLSVSKLIIESMGGQIDFISTSGKGSTFFFFLPSIEKGSFVADDGQLKELGQEAEAW